MSRLMPLAELLPDVAGIPPELTITGLVLDLSGVTFLDSTGIGALIDLSHDAEDLAVTFGLRNPGPRVVRILQMTGLDARWPVERSGT